jgi:hypothetical protein
MKGLPNELTKATGQVYCGDEQEIELGSSSSDGSGRLPKLKHRIPPLARDPDRASFII